MVILFLSSLHHSLYLYTSLQNSIIYLHCTFGICDTIQIQFLLYSLFFSTSIIDNFLSFRTFCFSPFLSNFAECPNIISLTCITFHHLRFPLPPEPSRCHMPTPILPSSDSLSANASPAYHKLQASPPVLRLNNFPIQRFRFVLLDNPMLLVPFSHLRIWIVHFPMEHPRSNPKITYSFSAGSIKKCLIISLVVSLANRNSFVQQSHL